MNQLMASSSWCSVMEKNKFLQAHPVPAVAGAVSLSFWREPVFLLGIGNASERFWHVWRLSRWASKVAPLFWKSRVSSGFLEMGRVSSVAFLKPSCVLCSVLEGTYPNVPPMGLLKVAYLSLVVPHGFLEQIGDPARMVWESYPRVLKRCWDCKATRWGQQVLNWEEPGPLGTAWLEERSSAISFSTIYIYIYM